MNTLWPIHHLHLYSPVRCCDSRVPSGFIMDIWCFSAVDRTLIKQVRSQHPYGNERCRMLIGCACFPEALCEAQCRVWRFLPYNTKCFLGLFLRYLLHWLGYPCGTYVVLMKWGRSRPDEVQRDSRMKGWNDVPSDTRWELWATACIWWQTTHPHCQRKFIQLISDSIDSQTRVFWISRKRWLIRIGV